MLCVRGAYRMRQTGLYIGDGNYTCNVHDSVAFDTVFERLKAHYPEVQFVTADAGYKTPWICKQIFDSGKIPSLPYKRPMTKKGNLPWNAYVYDEYYDCILCPQNQVLSYATTNREGYKEYKSKGYICRDCPETGEMYAKSAAHEDRNPPHLAGVSGTSRRYSAFSCR